MEAQIPEDLAELSKKVEDLSDDINGLSLQIECTHLHQVITGYFRDLREEAGEAIFAKEGEKGICAPPGGWRGFLRVGSG